jgi:hypothetical protein
MDRVKTLSGASNEPYRGLRGIILKREHKVNEYDKHFTRVGT